MKSQAEVPPEELQFILREAYTADATRVDFEYVSEGLEFTVMSGSSGLGSVITDREVERCIISYIVRTAGLERKSSGTFEFNVGGEVRKIEVEEYDSFGESAFRLHLRTSTDSRRNRKKDR